MSDFRISHRYAKSLLETALEKKKSETVSADMQLLADILHQNRKLQLMLGNPVIRPEQKLSILKEIFRNRISEETVEFLEFLVNKKRESLLLTIVKRFLELYDEYLGIANVHVTTATEFTDDQKKVLQSRLENILKKKVRLNFKIDLNLVGGFIAKVGDTLYDASIKHQLELLRKQFLTGEFSLN